jgi:hypothetical protein
MESRQHFKQKIVVVVGAAILAYELAPRSLNKSPSYKKN